MVRNANSMKTKLTQAFFLFVVALFDHINSGVFNKTKSGFHNIRKPLLIVRAGKKR